MDESTINRYTELAPAQVLVDHWIDLNFDLAPGQSVLCDVIGPEFGGGYVYKDAHVVGSATQNRFIYWKGSNDTIELVELSAEAELENNQVRIRFANSPIVNDVTVIEFSDSIVLMLTTTTSVHRLTLPHPKTVSKSILSELTTETLFNPANYLLINANNSPGSQQPICSTSWRDQNYLKCAICMPDSSIHIIQFSRHGHQVSTSVIKQIGIMGRLWSRMPNLLARSQNDCDNAVFICHPMIHPESNDVLLFTLCRDLKLRIFSTASKECISTHSLTTQSSFSQSMTSHTNLISELPMMRIFKSLIVVYLTEDGSEFLVLRHSFKNGQHILSNRVVIQTVSWEKLIDFAITDTKIWALANMRETQSSMCFIDIGNLMDENINDSSMDEFVWDFVDLSEEVDTSSVKNYVSEIFWRNRFSLATVQKALIGVAGPTVNKSNTMESLEEIAFTKICDENQKEAWAKFYNYCIQDQHSSNKPIGLIANPSEDLILIVKKSNPSFICPWLMSLDMALAQGPYRGIEFTSNLKCMIGPLNHIANELMNEELDYMFEQKLFESPSRILSIISELADTIFMHGQIASSKFIVSSLSTIANAINNIIAQLDLSQSSDDFISKLLNQVPLKMRPELIPLGSNCGITLIFEMLRRLVRARMILSRDLLIYLDILRRLSETDKISQKNLPELCHKIITSGQARVLIDSLRSYAALVWITETPIKGKPFELNSKFVDSISKHFEFFKVSSSPYKRFQDNSLEQAIRKNLFMNFLFNGGTNLSCLLDDGHHAPQTISNSHYVTDIVLNICKLLWPTSSHLCIMEYLFTHQLDEHLAKYEEFTNDWVTSCEYDRSFLKAANCVLQKRATTAVEIFNQLWPHIDTENMIGKFVGLERDTKTKESDESSLTSPIVIYRYYDKLIQTFQLIENNLQCLVKLINHCMSLLDKTDDREQQHWVNCFRAKLFQYYLELEEPEEAYHTMVLTTDPSLRTNCLRKFIVSHCEKEQWSSLISHPFIDIKDDFIDILVQKADSSDLSKLNSAEFYKASYYDLLFAFHVSDEEYRRAAHVMYNYAHRLAQEVPGIVSIKKQADCLLIALNALRCVPESEAFLEHISGLKSEGRSSVVKRYHDSESEKLENPDELSCANVVTCKDIEMRYQLTNARLKLLEKDRTANAIALSPLRPEETIAHLVSSSMYASAMDLAVLFRRPMETILDGLASKFVFISKLSAIDIATHEEIESNLSDIFSGSYSTIDTYNYVASSTSSFVSRLWHLIDYYLTKFDGIGHTYESEELSKTFGGTTVLMRAVAIKILSAGYDIPACLKKLYLARNTAELLKLLIKYDKLTDAAELATEMINRVLEPSNLYTFTSPLTSSDPPPIFLPTHLITLLINYLNEDATNMVNLKAASALEELLSKYRTFVKRI